MVTFSGSHCRKHLTRPRDYRTTTYPTIPLYPPHHRSQPTLRRYSTTRDEHYKTLSVPRDATKSQIKSSFYKLSKLYHPDVTKDPGAKEKFQAVSEAYAVLGDDRRRRAYDKSLSAADGTRHHHPAASSHYTPYDTVRRRGATHAWAYKPHPRQRASHTQRTGFDQPHAHPQAPPRRPDPFSSPNVQRATGRSQAEEAKYRSEMNKVNAESSLWRAIQVIGVVLVVVTVGGGFRASA
ncbi:DnaJ-domain-containing protein [Panus rudis PR-1116 ss-1]|nr:DnaJ-domain-containing protein [Panus rudis PR-1116 ss-1]